MPNIATALKSEISRIARKEVKAEVLSLRKSAISHRKEIADLKRRAQTLEQALRRAGSGRPPALKQRETEAPSLQRFSGKGLMAHRKRLGLSAADMALLFGTSSQTIYNWEQGKSRPSASHLSAVAALRTLGKKDAVAVIAARSGSPSTEG